MPNKGLGRRKRGTIEVLNLRSIATFLGQVAIFGSYKMYNGSRILFSFLSFLPLLPLLLLAAA